MLTDCTKLTSPTDSTDFTDATSFTKLTSCTNNNEYWAKGHRAIACRKRCG